MGHENLNLEHYKQLLLELRQRLLSVESMGNQAAETVELDQTRVGRLSRMDAMQAQAMSQATNARRDATLKAIEVALKAIQAGDYGECIECGQTINPKRLEIDPAARYCIDCASAKDS